MALAALILLAAGAWLRFAHLGKLELFVDEGGHLFASIDADARPALDPIGEGKPGMLWVFRPAAWLPFDPLLTARASVAAGGLVTALALATTLLLCFDAQAALLGLLLWAFLPFAVFHERLALLDPLIATSLACAIALAALAAARPAASRLALGLSFLAGGFAGAACLLKISAVTAAPWLAIVYVALQQRFAKKLFDRRLAAFVAGCAAPLLCLVPDLAHLGTHLTRATGGQTTALLRLYFSHGGWLLVLLLLAALGAPWLALVQAALRPPQASARRVRRIALLMVGGVLLGLFVIGSLVHLAASPGTENAPPVPLVHTYFSFGGWPFALLLLVALGVAAARPAPGAWSLGLAWLVSLLVAQIVFPSGYARYLHGDYLPLVLFLAAALNRWTALPTAIVVGGAVATWAGTDHAIVRDPTHAGLPPGEIRQYVTGPWSGDGTRALTVFLEQHAPCVVFAHPYSRAGSYATRLAARHNPAINFVPFVLEGPLATGALRAATTRAHELFGPGITIFVLAESDRPVPAEPALLRAGGIPFTTTFSHVKRDDLGSLLLLDCDL